MQRDLLEVHAVQEVGYRVLAMQKATPVHAAAEGSTKETMLEETLLEEPMVEEKRSHAEPATPFAYG